MATLQSHYTRMLRLDGAGARSEKDAANVLGIKGSTPAPAYIAIADIFKGGPYISAGPEMQVATIRQAQKNLKLLGYYNGPEDGMPNASLVSALKIWQKSAGFRQNGRFDESTLKGLDLMPN